MLARIGRLRMLRGLPFSKCSACDSGTPAALLWALTPPEVPAPVLPPAPRVPPRSPASLYDACVLMNGVRDARGVMLMREDTK